MLGYRIPDVVVMRYADGELPWIQRIPLRGALLLSPRLRQRVRNWRLFSRTVIELGGRRERSSLDPDPRLATERLEEGPVEAN